MNPLIHVLYVKIFTEPINPALRVLQNNFV
jgi:hypothetical protein